MARSEGAWHPDGAAAESASDTDAMNERTPLLMPIADRHNMMQPYCSDSAVNGRRSSNEQSGASDASGRWMSASGQLGDHCHVRSAKDDIADHAARRKLIIASIVCLCFMIGEAAGGIIANSLAIATDAAHLLTDLTSFLISLVSIYIAARPATKRMSFGWYRAEVVGALLSVLMIWVVTAALVYLAVQRVINQDYDINAPLMIIMAGLSVVFNIFMCIVLQNGAGHGHSHSSLLSDSPKRTAASDSASSSHRPAASIDAHASQSGHNSDLQLAAGDDELMTTTCVTWTDETRNINVKAALIHVIGDLLQSFGVLIAAYIIFYKPEWKIADPICTFVFSVLVLFTTAAIIRDIFAVLMEAAPRDISFRELRQCLCSLDGVRELHDMRLWSLTTTKAALSVHLTIDRTVDTQQLLAMASAVVRERFGIDECTFQMEYYVPEMGDCTQCREPSD